MKHGKQTRILALALVFCLSLSFAAPAYAAGGARGGYGSGYSISDWFRSIWERIGRGGSETPSEPDEDLELTLVEDETTVAEGTQLRASTYAAGEPSAQAETTTLKYFPVTLYDYDAATINNATHQKEVDNGLGNTWNGIYFSSGAPGAESYTYSIGETSYTYSSTTVSYSNNNNYSTYTNGSYYVKVNNDYYVVTNITCTRSGSDWWDYTYSWTITYDGGSTTSSNSSITLYTRKASNTVTTGKLDYADWNWWNKNTDNNNYGQYTYSGLVNSTLDANKNISFTKPDGGIFNDDANVKTIYTNVEMPFVYKDGTYTFDAGENGAYFSENSSQGSTKAQSNGRLYFNEGNPQSNGGSYGDGSKTVWMPFNSIQNIGSENNCNYHFGMAATIPFTMTANGKMNPNDGNSEDITFTFSGDDDVWVFIDGQLVLDIGGIHNRLDATINFAENTWSLSKSNKVDVAVADYNGKAISGTLFNEGNTTGTLNQTRETFAAKDSHELTIFYLERGAGSSNCKIEFNLPMKDSVSVKKIANQSKTKNGQVSDLTAEEQTMVNNTDFGFTLYKDGDKVANTNYSLLNENGQYLETQATDANGHFYLKAGQTAKFVGTIKTNSYYVVEDSNANYVEPSYAYSANVAQGVTETLAAAGWTSMTVTSRGGSDEKEDSIVFTCTNYLSAELPNPTSSPADDRIVIDYGLPVVIDVLKNDVYKGSYSLAEVSDGTYGTAVKNDDGTITYQLTKQLTGVEVLTYKAAATNGDQTVIGEAKVYIIPATSMYYEENFSDLVTFTGSWSDMSTPQTDPQEPGVVGTVGDSPYGSDAAYLNDSGDSNGSSKHVSTASASASFSYTFTGTGTSFFARTDTNTAVISIEVTKVVYEEGKQVTKQVHYQTRNTIYKPVNENDVTNIGTLYNIPVFTIDGLDYDTYTVNVTVLKAVTALKYGSEFWLDGIRVINPLNSTDANVSIAEAAYASDGEANMTVATLREKLIGEAQINGDTISWNEGDNFVIFTDTNGQIDSAEEYKSNGPKEEVYLNDGQSVTFSLAGWDANSNKIYLGIKAPVGSGSVSINDHALSINNATDCYYDISSYAAITTDAAGVKNATFTITAASRLISVTNIKVTGNAEFTIVNQKDVNEEDVPVEGNTNGDPGNEGGEIIVDGDDSESVVTVDEPAESASAAESSSTAESEPASEAEPADASSVPAEEDKPESEPEADAGSAPAGQPAEPVEPEPAEPEEAE